MKKFLVAMGLVAFAFVGCDDSSSASAGLNDEPSVESSSSSDTQNDSKQFSSSEKSGRSSSSVDDTSSSSRKEPVSSSGFVGNENCPGLQKYGIRWNWNVPKECRFNPDIDYGTMTDERDGNIYKTVKIGDQVWMAENLNYYDATDLSVKKNSWCYGQSDRTTCFTCGVAGRYYTWSAAIDSVKLANDADNPQNCGFRKLCSLPAKVRGICPSGWHLPDVTEWNVLFETVGGQSEAGKVLKSQSGWNGDNGSDAVGFSALPAGVKNDSGYFVDDGIVAYFWSASEVINYESVYAYSIFLDNGHESATLYSFRKTQAFSVRCVKD